jgi:hypothetical protein
MFNREGVKQRASFRGRLKIQFSESPYRFTGNCDIIIENISVLHAGQNPAGPYQSYLPDPERQREKWQMV